MPPGGWGALPVSYSPEPGAELGAFLPVSGASHYHLSLPSGQLCYVAPKDPMLCGLPTEHPHPRSPSSRKTCLMGPNMHSISPQTQLPGTVL